MNTLALTTSSIVPRVWCRSIPPDWLTLAARVKARYEQINWLLPDGDSLRALLRTRSSRPLPSLSGLRAPLGVRTGRCVGATEP